MEVEEGKREASASKKKDNGMYKNNLNINGKYAITNIWSAEGKGLDFFAWFCYPP